jgi:hypothetical protein
MHAPIKAAKIKVIRARKNLAMMANAESSLSLRSYLGAADALLEAI